MDKRLLKELAANKNMSLEALRTAKPEIFKALNAKLGEEGKEALIRNLGDASPTLKRALTAIKPDDHASSDAAETIRNTIKNADATPAEKEGMLARFEALQQLETQALKTDQPLALEPAFRAELAKADIVVFTDALKIKPEIVDAILAKAESLDDINDTILNDLVSAQKLDEKSAKTLGQQISLFNLADGHVEVTAALSKLGPRGSVPDLRDLAGIAPEEMTKTLRDLNVKPREGETLEGIGRDISRRLDQAYPFESMTRQFVRPDENILAKGLEALAPLLEADKDILAKDFEAVDISVLAEREQERVRQAHEEVTRFSRRYPGLGIEEALSKEGAFGDRVKNALSRIAIVDQVIKQNPNVEFLALDYSQGSDDLRSLKFDGLNEADTKAVISTFKAQQRVFAVTDEPVVTAKLMEAGYSSAIAIARDDLDDFLRKSKIDPDKGRTIYERANGTMAGVSAVVGSVMDVVKGGFAGMAVGNLFEDVSDGLKQMEGYADLFGPTEVCDCDHCQSILSPAAYFVDLMYFTEQHVTKRDFTGAKADHALNLKVRRPDLWHLELSCENTNTLIPTLVVVNETLESYIAKRFKPAINLSDRKAVQQFVYGERLVDEQASFASPFLLAAAKADTYLEAFECTRAGLAEAAGLEGTPGYVAAFLKLSSAEYDLITTPNTAMAYLRNLYAFNFVVGGGGAIDSCEVQELLPFTGLSRDDFGALTETRFVRADGARNVRIKAQKRNADSVQNDVERVLGLDAAALDAMHRFTRLWRATPWTIAELDLVLKQRSPNAAPVIDAAVVADVALVMSLTATYGLSVEEACGLWSEVPRVALASGKRSLFDRLYNNRPYAVTEGVLPKNAVSFVHPAFRPSATALPEDNTLQRLLLGLQLSETALAELIDVLKGALGANLADANPDLRGFALTSANLSLLYRHARLMRLLRRSAPELGKLVAFAGIAGGAVNSLASLHQIIAFDGWLRASGYGIDDLSFTTGGALLVPGQYPSDASRAATLIDGVTNDGALIFADTIFAFVPGVTEDMSKAIIAANAALFDVQPQGMLRLKAAAGLAPALVVPAGVPAALADLQEVLGRYHTARILPLRVAALLGLTPERLSALGAMAGVNFAAANLATALQGGASAPLEALIGTLAKLAILFKSEDFTPQRLAFLSAEKARFGIADYKALTIDHIRALSLYQFLIVPRPAVAPEDAPDPLAVEEALIAFTAAQGFSALAQDRLGKALGVAGPVATALASFAVLGNEPLTALSRLAGLARLTRESGIGADTIKLLISQDGDDLDRGAESLVSILRQLNPDEKDFTARMDPLENRLHGRKRDALADHVIRKSHERFTSMNDLYAYFLIDPQFQGCARTSRVVAAISSVQTYIHRILLNLEQDRRDIGDPDHVHVLPSRIPLDEWSWRKNYRVWEANRKVFLWPENYIEPELRDDKTPLFKALEEGLLQQDINEQNVLDAYGDYLNGFEEVAGLKIAGVYHETSWSSGTDLLHVFGATMADPPVYYYWTVSNLFYSRTDPDRAVSFSPRKKIDVSIPVRQVSPIVHMGRLFVFWNEITSSSKNRVRDGESKFIGYKHKIATKFVSLRLDGSWTPPQNLTLRLDNNLKSGQIINDHLSYKGSTSNFGVPWRSPEIRIHDEYEEGYTLYGFQWEKVFPAVFSGRMIMNSSGIINVSEVDLFEQRQNTIPSSFLNALRAYWDSRREVLHVGRGDGVRKLYRPTVNPSVLWGNVSTPYAVQAIAADIDTAEDYYVGWGVWPDNLSTYRINFGIEPGRRGPAIGRLRQQNAKVSASAGGMGGGGLVLQSSHDAAYVFRISAFLSSYQSVRLTTTISRELSRILFTGGINTLLDIKTQKSLGEDDHILEPLNDGLSVAGQVGSIDFNGAMGTYYKEIFFHIPFLIADHLNGRQNFAAAQNWYHYIFDPTSTLDPSISLAGLSAGQRKKVLRDRVWHYIQFRNLTPPKLRDILSDEAAIKAYKEDPFNPHAIARLRISAYQKSVVMKYVSNLIDWGDSLFTQFTMESVNEAIVLYVMAEEILGRRPAKVGDCGEGALSPKNYETIRPTIDKGSEFLLEAESLLWIAPKAKKFSRFIAEKQGRSFVDYVRAESDMHRRVAKEAATAILAAPKPGPDDIRTTRVEKAEGGRPYETQAMAMRIDERSMAAMDVEETPKVIAYAASYAETAQDRSRRYDLVRESIVAEPMQMTVAMDDNPALSHQMDWRKTRAVGWAKAAGKGTRIVGNDSILINDYGRVGRFGWGIVRQLGPVFCVPENKDLKALWDRVEDRLYKIRNCLDITGARRHLSLFAPEIDPRLLVRARAEGLSLEDVLGASSGNLPPYRFSYLIDKAKSYASSVQGFGSHLLAALEKRDGEELTRLRNSQALNMAKLTTRLREWELKIAEETISQLERQKAAITYRRDYYNGLVEGDLSGWERTQQVLRHASTGFYTLGALFGGTAGVLSLIPQVGSPFAMKYGGHELGSSFKGWSMCFSDTAKLLDVFSASAGLEASFERRREGWEHQVELAEHELKQMEKQIKAAEIRRDIATRSIELHKKNIEDQEEIIDFFKEKFSNLGLYTWMSSSLQRLYRQTFNTALAMAKLAERAYRFERGDETTSLLDASYWDASKAGLLAGERLMSDLLAMEKRFIETNYRMLEIDQSFSAMQLAPDQLLKLRETGECEIAIPEYAFDLFYPGHYRRRIKAARLTIPCVTGPYTNISATLTLKQSFIRKDPQTAAAALVEVPLRHTSSVATSSAQNDSGVFDFSFRDERYMPFEGAGAVSVWTVTLPKTFRPFDYQTINDVIIHLSYSAMADGVMRQKVEDSNAALEGSIANALTNTPLSRAYSLRQDFSSSFQRLINSPLNTLIPLDLDERALPIVLRGRAFNVSRALLLIRPKPGLTAAGTVLKLNGQDFNAFTASPEFPGWRSANVQGALAAGLLARHTLSIVAPGDLAPAAGDPAAVDVTKMLDIALYLEIGL